ncbi:MAG TPA: ABC transporter substrate-binding protein [Rubrivivax sp.]|nr:ABC transporter substrate-binding protein [Rubrivivax sp.]
MHATRSIRAALFLAAALALACGPALAQNKVRFAYLKTINIIPFFYANQKGYFKAEGVDLELIAVQGGPAAAAAIASGSADVAYAAPTVVITARAQQQPFRYVIGLDWERTPDRLYDIMLASKRSGVKSFKDLVGKTVLMNAPGSLTEMAWRDWLAKSGMKWSDVKVLVNPFPQNQAMLELGTADAVAGAEPFIASMKRSKVEPVILGRGFLAEETRRYAIDGIFASDTWAAANGKTIAAMKRALAKGVSDLKSDRTLMRKIMIDEYKLKPEVVDSITVPVDPHLDLEAQDLVPVLEAMERTGMVKPGLSASDLVVGGK